MTTAGGTNAASPAAESAAAAPSRGRAARNESVVSRAPRTPRSCSGGARATPPRLRCSQATCAERRPAPCRRRRGRGRSDGLRQSPPAPVVRHLGDERRKLPKRLCPVPVAVIERRMKPKRRKPGVREVTGPKVALGERSLDRATHLPHPAHALGEVFTAPNRARMARQSRRSPLSEERAGLVEGAGAALAAQQIEQVAMLAGRRVHPPPGMGGGPDPHEERAPGIAHEHCPPSSMFLPCAHRASSAGRRPRRVRRVSPSAPRHSWVHRFEWSVSWSFSSADRRRVEARVTPARGLLRRVRVDADPGRGYPLSSPRCPGEKIPGPLGRACAPRRPPRARRTRTRASPGRPRSTTRGGSPADFLPKTYSSGYGARRVAAYKIL